MDSLAAIIKQRLPPGILIFDLCGRLRYSNRQATEILGIVPGTEGEKAIPPEIFRLCRQAQEEAEATGSMAGAGGNSVLTLEEGHPCSLRAFLVGTAGDGHIIVLLERVVEKHQVDIEKARKDFGLSKREAEVVRFVCQGLANRDISEKLFISEYTVKDHVKNIMKKMDAGSRNEIISFLR